jgi:hypothetical protein
MPDLPVIRGRETGALRLFPMRRPEKKKNKARVEANRVLLRHVAILTEFL